METTTIVSAKTGKELALTVEKTDDPSVFAFGVMYDGRTLHAVHLGTRDRRRRQRSAVGMFLSLLHFDACCFAGTARYPDGRQDLREQAQARYSAAMREMMAAEHVAILALDDAVTGGAW